MPVACALSPIAAAPDCVACALSPMAAAPESVACAVSPNATDDTPLARLLKPTAVALTLVARAPNVELPFPPPPIALAFAALAALLAPNAPLRSALALLKAP